MCDLPNPGGRVSLLDMELTIHEQGRLRKKRLPAGPKYVKALSKHFGIELGAEYEDFIL
jgi:arylamine N-acetyltransferase